VQSNVSNGFEDIVLVHRALPEVNMDEVDVAGTLLGKKIQAPIMIAGMTGGA
jgi:isopentenyl-diphosphate delta-isomerase